MSGTDAFSYATNTAVGAATSSRIIGERELRSLPLKKKKQGRITTSTFKNYPSDVFRLFRFYICKK